MTYPESLILIEAMNKRKKLSPMYLRLERLRQLFAELDVDPELPSVHIAGTSGKGSTSSLCADVLRQAGYTVGLHISPHLQTPRERMQVNGQMPSEAVFTHLAEQVYAAALHVEDRHSYGAFSTNDLLFTIAMLYFGQQRVDIAIIETFMGGQYDATNAIKPLVSVVTNVDLDHTKVLGSTVEAIAMVKAGVIKSETPFITGATQSSVIEIFKKRAADLGTSCIVVGEENKYRVRHLGQRGSILSVQVIDNLFANLHLKLLGKHQINNALMVLYIIQVLRSRGWLITDQAIRESFAKAFIPGRLEVVQENPLVILDGAHNPAKAKALASSLRRIFRQKPVIFVFAMKKGKDLNETLKPLLTLADRFIITSLPGSKGQPPAKIREAIRSKGIPAMIRLDPPKALQLALRYAGQDHVICVTGSLYLVGQLRTRWYPSQALESIESDDLPTRTTGEPFANLPAARSHHDR